MPDEQALKNATDVIAHRGPDHSATRSVRIDFGGDSVGAGFGHRRLAIIDLDTRSNQPFGETPGILVYNGEIYNFRELRGQLAAGRSLHTESDTEVLFHLLAEKGVEALNSANGMWSFCFWDKPRNTVIAARDRYGKKPLFYRLTSDTLIIASEAKAIFRYQGTTPSFRADKVAHHIAVGTTFPDADGTTFFEDIREVRPGHALKLDLRQWSISEEAWHDFDRHVSGETGELAEVFESAVLSRLISDRPVGLLLSGGIDSTLLLSVLIANKLQDTVHCFIGETGETVSQDAAYARQCAQIAGIKVTEVDADYGKSAFDRILDMCWHHEKPFPLTGNSVAMHEMYSHIKNYDVPVVLDGTGGDEVFGGYWDRYAFFALRDAINAGDLKWISYILNATRNDEQASKRLVAAMKRLTAPARAEARLDRRTKKYAFPAVATAQLADPLTNFDGTLAGAMALDATRGRLPEWIWHNDRNSMSYGIESRSPFLDCNLIPFINQPYSTKFVGPWNKHSLRKLYGKFTELPTQWRRQKQGFRWPAGTFLQQNKDAIFEAIAEADLLRDYVDLKKFLDDASKDPGMVTDNLTAKLFCIAGLHQKFGSFFDEVPVVATLSTS